MIKIAADESTAKSLYTLFKNCITSGNFYVQESFKTYFLHEIIPILFQMVLFVIQRISLR